MAEDYSEEEIERLQEELATVKRRFSHNKVKRKWVSEEGGGGRERSAPRSMKYAAPGCTYTAQYCTKLQLAKNTGSALQCTTLHKSASH